MGQQKHVTYIHGYLENISVSPCACVGWHARFSQFKLKKPGWFTKTGEGELLSMSIIQSESLHAQEARCQMGAKCWELAQPFRVSSLLHSWLKIISLCLTVIRLAHNKLPLFFPAEHWKGMIGHKICLFSHCTPSAPDTKNETENEKSLFAILKKEHSNPKKNAENKTATQNIPRHLMPDVSTVSFPHSCSNTLSCWPQLCLLDSPNSLLASLERKKHLCCKRTKEARIQPVSKEEIIRMSISELL